MFPCSDRPVDLSGLKLGKWELNPDSPGLRRTCAKGMQFAYLWEGRWRLQLMDSDGNQLADWEV